MRAGLQPWALDLFADRDLAAACPATAVPGRHYPAALADLARTAPPGPWLYTGALENWPELVAQIAQDRPLWGNDAACLRRVRDPFALAAALRAAGLPCPAVRRPDDRPVAGQWLLKPIASGGGTGIRFTTFKKPVRRLSYVQEFIEGNSCSAVFLAGRADCRLLGVTRQLVGESWVHTPPFRYAGSIGPLELSAAEHAAWERLGAVIAAFAGLRGLFGVDAVVRDGMPWPVEVNPRYTASVEVLEYATGMRALALHRRVFEPEAPKFADGPAADIIGKAVWYAPRPLTVPGNGPWEAVLNRRPAIDSPPPFADIPRVGQRIAAGHPVLTMIAAETTVDECRRRLQTIAGEMDAWLLR
jgi:predicted ATP-grasp superfamily ATP-dependent carboligase